MDGESIGKSRASANKVWPKRDTDTTGCPTAAKELHPFSGTGQNILNTRAHYWNRCFSEKQ